MAAEIFSWIIGKHQRPTVVLENVLTIFEYENLC